MAVAPALGYPPHGQATIAQLVIILAALIGEHAQAGEGDRVWRRQAIAPWRRVA
jgi:hypothetical protein